MPAGGGNVSVDLRKLLPTAHQMPLHVTAVELKLVATITPHATEDEPGTNICRILDRIELYDIDSETIVRLQGHHVDQLVKCATGWRYADPGTIVAAGQADDFTWQGRIPFHGGPAGLAGFQDFKDVILPVDRIRETNMEIYFNAAALANATLGAVTLYVSFTCGPYSSVMLGADVRYGYMTHSDAQRIELPTTGKAVHTAALCVDDLDASDITVVNVDQFSYLNNVQLWQLIHAWNSMVAFSPSEHVAIGSPEFAPLIFQDRRGSIQQSLGFPGQKALMDVTNTVGEDMDLCWVQVHNTKRKADKLIGRAGTAFEDKRLRKAQFSKKNGPTMNQTVGKRLETLLPQKLVKGVGIAK
jgi:hypothetical protein